MPTVILLDVSLSMSRPVAATDNNESYTRRNMAIHGVNTLLDNLASLAKLEFVSLVIFSKRWEVLVPFTREYGEIRNALLKLEDYSKTGIMAALTAARQLVLDEWGTNSACQIVLITDGSVGLGPGSLKESIQTYNSTSSMPAKPSKSLFTSDTSFPLPFPFPSTLHLVCVAPPEEQSLQEALPLYHKLIEINDNHGYLHTCDVSLTLSSMSELFTGMVEKHFQPLRTVLKCGNLKCQILVYPPPPVYNSAHDFSQINISVAKTLHICGFLDITDIASPPYITRHLLVPTTPTPEEVAAGAEEVKEDNPAFTVLLHGALKVEGMVALVQLAQDWFGIIYSWADSKKKSSLMLSIFRPGTDILPWLGNLSHLAPTQDFTIAPYGEENNKTPFPVRPLERRSYAQNCVVWIKPSGLQADLQKVLRNARKLPEKQPHFYKELNRIRRAALSVGFQKLLETMAQLLERECALLPGNTHPDASLQLTHAANALRTPAALDYSLNIQPMRTNFSGE